MVGDRQLWILGAGDLGGRLVRALDGDDWKLLRVRRNPPPGEPGWLAGDLGDGGFVRRLMDAPVSHILMTMTADGRGADDYRRAYLRPLQLLLDGLRGRGLAPHLIYVSSTSVYGQDDGGWVDEDSVRNPARASARVLVEAENLLLSQTAVPHTILRCSGLYDGPGRLAQRLRDGDAAPASIWSNRIHRDDVAGFVRHLLARAAPAPCYLLSDSCPVPLPEVMAFVAQRLGLPPPPAPAVPLRGKRCDNRRMLATGYRLLYPSFAEGYARL